MATKKAVPVVDVADTDDDALLAIDPAHAREARALDKSVIVPLRVNLTFARANALAAATAVLGASEAIEKKVKKPDWKAVRRLVALVDSTHAASRALMHIDKAATTYEADLAALRPLRERLLSMAGVLASAGLVPKAAVEAIRAGRGERDAATDLIDLADLFTKHARKLSGKMGPITKEDLVSARKLGQRLLATIKPTNLRGTKAVDTEREDARALRDRLNTLLVIDYETTWFLGAAAFGSKVDNFVPPLGSGGTRPPAEKPEKAKKPEKTKKPVAEEPEEDDA